MQRCSGFLRVCRETLCCCVCVSMKTICCGRRCEKKRFSLSQEGRNRKIHSFHRSGLVKVIKTNKNGFTSEKETLDWSIAFACRHLGQVCFGPVLISVNNWSQFVLWVQSVETGQSFGFLTSSELQATCLFEWNASCSRSVASSALFLKVFLGEKGWIATCFLAVSHCERGRRLNVQYAKIYILICSNIRCKLLSPSSCFEMITFIGNVSGAWCLSVCLFDCGCLILFTVRVDAH